MPVFSFRWRSSSPAHSICEICPASRKARLGNLTVTDLQSAAADWASPVGGSHMSDLQRVRNGELRTSSHQGEVTLIGRAKALSSTLRERAAETNRLRRLPDGTWKDLLTSGIIRGLQPARWGGGEVHPREFYSAVIEVARADGCAGWVAGIVGVHPWQTALYAEQTQQEVWGEDPTVMNSSSYAPTGKAERVAGGYRLSGRWSFSSGC